MYGETKTEKEQKPAVQAGEDTAFDTSHGGHGDGLYASRSEDRAVIPEVTGSRPGSEYVEEAGDVEQPPDSDMESNVVPTSRGAGNIHNVTVDDSRYYYTAVELENGLLYDLKPLAPLFVQAQDKYGIDAVFLAAIAAEESGWGRNQFRKNNIFGFYGPQFENLEQCIDYVANFLLAEYLTPDGKYYKGTSVVAVNTHYNGRETWEDHVTMIMANIVNRIERTDSE